MERHREHLTQHALALACAAEQLAESAGDRASAIYLPAALACVEQTLEALGRACLGAAHALVPLDDPFEPASQRLARAARDWPGARGGAGPSHERQVELLASLDKLGASLGAGQHDAARARKLLLAAMEPPAAMEAPRAVRDRPVLHAASAVSG